MLVKGRTAEYHVADLNETFFKLRKYQMKLNPAKCAFGVTSSKFLGFIVTQHGVEANTEKIRALQEMVLPKTVKEVQRLTGRIAALGRFVSRSAERCLPFFRILKRPKDFLWSEECQQAFEELRCLLASPPLLTKPQQGELLYLYLAVSPVAVSSVLVREENKLQKPVYYANRVLRDAEIRYSKLEKTIFTLIISARRLRPYFQTHTAAILTDQPMKQILQWSDRAGRIAKWAVELGEFDLEYRLRPAIKAQALADFIVECTLPDDPEYPLISTEETPKPPWVLYVDGSSTSGDSGAGLILTSPDGIVAEQALRLEFSASNNEAEYEALIAGLKLAKELKVEDLKVYSDSQLVVSQVLGNFEAKEPSMQKYLQKVRELISALDAFNIQHIPRMENLRADLLSKLATSRMSELPKATVLEYLQTPSTEEPEPAMCIDTEPSWIDELVNYLQSEVLPDDELESRRIRRQASRFILYEGKLYRKSFTSPLLRCLRPSEADYAMREVHEGICGNHLGGRALAHKILRQGYFWPTLQKDAIDFVRRTIFRLPTSETPFNLAYGMEAIIPLEIGLPSPRVEHYNAASNSSQLRGNLDLVEETREAARVRTARYQRKTAQYYNSRVKAKLFKVGDLVLRRAETSQTTEQGKRAPNWEGPYRITRVQRPGAYKLETLKGTSIPRSWNSENLWMYYQ
ncbi:uncharacterized protein LOC120104693 [Phoenix dactylifera]|uniref:Uncharacterized protein LOC120104693 n=1 Tax=Phoenix dactylifera TaxID=42345 RepID=A0A8B8ZDJ3_PHODC|nr:uncharacterized protein LOC120104693 [Phoenix dactylifera]